MTGLVIDASVTLGWCFVDEGTDYASGVLRTLETTRAQVPSLWCSEVANAFLMGERRKRSSEADTARWTEFLHALPIDVEDTARSRVFSEVLALARAQKLSAYDAAYLELALRRSLPLATLDGRLKAAADAVGVVVYAPG